MAAAHGLMIVGHIRGQIVRAMFLSVAVGLAISPVALAQRQMVDPDFKPVVTRPAYAANGPVVAIDEAHGNFHTAGGQYRPFADLLRADGYKVTSLAKTFDSQAFEGVDVLVIANAEGPDEGAAFTEAECKAVRAWVEAGGSLLLVADHAPFGAGAANLGKAFGVDMGKGWAYEPTANGVTTQLVYSRENGRLGSHAITAGRDASERLNLVRTFTGQSLGVPNGASVLLRFPDNAREAPHTDDLNAAAALVAAGKPEPAPNTFSIAGRTQGIAMAVGKGKIVVLGEAGMFSAQQVVFPPGSAQKDFKFGMNVPGTDDRQFALNVMHWLSGILK